MSKKKRQNSKREITIKLKEMSTLEIYPAINLKDFINFSIENNPVFGKKQATKTLVRTALNYIFDSIVALFKNKKSVKISGFGKFLLKKKRIEFLNKKTNKIEKMDVYSVSFVPSKLLKDKIRRGVV